MNIRHEHSTTEDRRSRRKPRSCIYREVSPCKPTNVSVTANIFNMHGAYARCDPCISHCFHSHLSRITKLLLAFRSPQPWNHVGVCLVPSREIALVKAYDHPHNSWWLGSYANIKPRFSAARASAFIKFMLRVYSRRALINLEPKYGSHSGSFAPALVQSERLWAILYHLLIASSSLQRTR